MKKQLLIDLFNERRIVSNNKLNYAENFLIHGGTAKDLLHDPTYISLSEKEEHLINKRNQLFEQLTVKKC